MKNHPFDRYRDYTDLPALLEATAKPLRKSVRANKLKTTSQAVQHYAKEKGWEMEAVPWCDDAWFVDRPATDDEGNAREALGKDPLHLLGHLYLQEAASMLPAALLRVEEGNAVLDMSAAPGSKTTQIASTLNGSGIIVANDVQEKRLWTLKTALHRSGVTNVLVTKKVGQWFGGHMTERFDRVLCDAPCTAQGTARKDSDALTYCSLENIRAMASLQWQLLQSAIHSAKVGGLVVYSTCTLTPEENEGIVQQALDAFDGQIALVNPAEHLPVTDGFWDIAMEDSLRVQHAEGMHREMPLLRLWPQRYDTEGFFCAVFRKVAPTKHPLRRSVELLQEKPLPASRARKIRADVQARFGSDMFAEDERLLERGKGSIVVATDSCLREGLPVRDFAVGMPAGKQLRDGTFIPSHELVTARGGSATRCVIDISDEEFQSLLAAQDIAAAQTASGHVIVRWRGIPVGLCLAMEGRLKNNLPRWMAGMYA